MEFDWPLATGSETWPGILHSLAQNPLRLNLSPSPPPPSPSVKYSVILRFIIDTYPSGYLKKKKEKCYVKENVAEKERRNSPSQTKYISVSDHKLPFPVAAGRATIFPGHLSQFIPSHKKRELQGRLLGG